VTRDHRDATIVRVIRNAVMHLNNEQPLLADLFELPSATDVGLRCTNLRTMSGNRPVFIDNIASTFFFPYLHIRFIEMPPAAGAVAVLPDGVAAADAVVEEEDELELDEDFLRRIREA
jgi:hypothetical protein